MKRILLLFTLLILAQNVIFAMMDVSDELRRNYAEQQRYNQLIDRQNSQLRFQQFQMMQQPQYNPMLNSGYQQIQLDRSYYPKMQGSLYNSL